MGRGLHPRGLGYIEHEQIFTNDKNAHNHLISLYTSISINNLCFDVEQVEASPVGFHTGN